MQPILQDLVNKLVTITPASTETPLNTNSIYENFTVSELMKQADLYYDIGDFSKVFEIYALPQIISNRSVYGIVQANLGFLYFTGNGVVQNDDIALDYFNSAILNGVNNAIPMKLVILLQKLPSDDSLYSKTIDTIKLAHSENNATVALWIGAIMNSTDDSEECKNCIGKFCQDLSYADQLEFLKSSLTIQRYSSYVSYDYQAPQVFGTYFERVLEARTSTLYIYTETTKRYEWQNIEILESDMKFIYY